MRNRILIYRISEAGICGEEHYRENGENVMNSQKKNATRAAMRWRLLVYDALICIFACVMLLIVYPSSIDHLSHRGVLAVMGMCLACSIGSRYALDVYRQIWRYGGMQAYIRLIAADVIGGALFTALRYIAFVPKITLPRAIALMSINLLGALTMRIVYQYLYQSTYSSFPMRVLRWFLRVFVGLEVGAGSSMQPGNRIKIAIVGAGSVGVMLAEELMRNPRASYEPVCFIDTDEGKIGRIIYGIRVMPEAEMSYRRLAEMSVQEVVFALPQVEAERRKELYDYYKRMGCKVKVYDFPTMQAAEGGRRQLREFQIEELLFRQTVEIRDEGTENYYRGKTVLITGGGGSIGSELCRQIARMEPKMLVVVDVYENGAYDLQQELRIKYGKALRMAVEIASVCDRMEMEEIFAQYQPEIVLHAAAHKHVPLMEHNVCEAVKNNVFGTQNVLDVARKYGAKRFIMISTDKAVNPTNVMGATKRMCEMLVLSRSEGEEGCMCSCTRFGNVLGSAGSVVPLFQRQILNGGPVTITDRRIIRYFMTIPEASQLVLQSGEMAKDGELFVLDMGKPVRILELAENMIRLMGYEPYKDIDIVETGLRPGEKLYEELLIKDEKLSKTKNELIFVEKDRRLSPLEINEKLEQLRKAMESRDEEEMRKALKRAVPTFRDPDEINKSAGTTDEMRMAAS